jgi:hypothetical protein
MERVAGIERRMTEIDSKLAEHLQWHGDPSGSPADVVRPRTNSGPQPGRRHRT